MRRSTVGVDTGKRAHQVAIYDPLVDGILGQASFPVSRAGFERLMAFLDQHAPDQTEVLVGIEAAGHYHVPLIEFLLERRYAVGLVNPSQATQFRRSQAAKAKTDRIDARALARFVACSGLRALSPTDARLAGPVPTLTLLANCGAPRAQAEPNCSPGFAQRGIDVAERPPI